MNDAHPSLVVSTLEIDEAHDNGAASEPSDDIRLLVGRRMQRRSIRVRLGPRRVDAQMADLKSRGRQVGRWRGRWRRHIDSFRVTGAALRQALAECWVCPGTSQLAINVLSFTSRPDLDGLRG